MAEWLGETSHGLFRRFPQVSTLVNSPKNFTEQFWHSQLFRGGSRNGTRRESNCGFRFNKETGFLRHSIPPFILHTFVNYLLSSFLSIHRLEIFPKNYTTGFVSQKLYTLKVRKLQLFSLKRNSVNALISVIFVVILLKFNRVSKISTVSEQNHTWCL